MNKFEKIKAKNIDELVDWIDKYFAFDSAPFWFWWDKKHCNKCESVIAHSDILNRECEFAWCELNGKCKFFEDMDDIPDVKQIIKMWLESDENEVDDEDDIK